MRHNEWEELRKKDETLRLAAKILSVSPDDLPKVVDRFLKEIKEMESRK